MSSHNKNDRLVHAVCEIPFPTMKRPPRGINKIASGTSQALTYSRDTQINEVSVFLQLQDGAASSSLYIEPLHSQQHS
jgi:hypothetical protein